MKVKGKKSGKWGKSYQGKKKTKREKKKKRKRKKKESKSTIEMDYPLPDYDCDYDGHCDLNNADRVSECGGPLFSVFSSPLVGILLCEQDGEMMFPSFCDHVYSCDGD